MNWFRVYIVPRVSVVPCIRNLAKCETLKQFFSCQNNKNYIQRFKEIIKKHKTSYTNIQVNVI